MLVNDNRYSLRKPSIHTLNSNMAAKNRINRINKSTSEEYKLTNLCLHL